MKIRIKWARDYKADEICAAEGLLMLSETFTPKTPAAAATAAPPPAAVEDGPKPNHTCDVCGAGFPSPRALDGHKTLHRPKASTAAAALAVSGGGKEREHECSECHRKFSTGQALGGHKRKHYEGIIGGGGEKRKSGKSSPSGSPARGSSGSVREEEEAPSPRGRVVLGIDLNLPYVDT